MRVSENGFGVAGKLPAKNRFVNEVDTELDGVAASDLRNVIAELVFLLVALDRESGDGGGKLIVAESFEP